MRDQLTELDKEDLLNRIQDALHTYADRSNDSPFADLFLFRQIRGNRASSSHEITNDIIRELIQEVKDQDPQLGMILYERHIEEKAMYTVALHHDISEATGFRRQKEAIEFMAQLLFNREVAARSNLQDQFLARLEPSTNSQLFGVDKHLGEIYRRVLDRNDPWLILLEGMGGIGKTSLADTLMRHAITHYAFDEFAWVSARREQFSLGGEIRPLVGAALTAPALLERLGRQLLPPGSLPVPFIYDRGLAQIKAFLYEHPGLIVVDNLETIQDVEELLPTLQVLANPSKFLLTSRTSLDQSAPIFAYRVPPLNRGDALELVRHEAKSRNLPNLAKAADKSLRPIYDTVGGNPLALRLVVGQATLHALAAVLSALKDAQGRSVDHLYTFIYRQAWDNLDAQTRLAFLAMPLVPADGGNLDLIGAASGLAPGATMDALARLVRLNLVDNRRGALNQSRYTIHPLTRTFLQEQVAKWQ